jgi:ring-1,2-phenylacetyl-CoA epoxidase subunit PaaC
MGAQAAPAGYLLHLADNALVLGQRNAEWCANGPVLEEDIAMANISLDLIGQSRLLYQHAAAVLGNGATEDRLAYFRGAADFRNFTLLELPHGAAPVDAGAAAPDYATTTVRNFLYSTFMLRLWSGLQQSSDGQLAAIAAKASKEVRYHVRHSRDWLVRFGDGTGESHARAQAALDRLFPYTGEFWVASSDEATAIAAGSAADPLAFRAGWDEDVDETLQEATLRRPAVHAGPPPGKQGRHSGHLAPLLADMQGLARQHPQAMW